VRRLFSSAWIQARIVNSVMKMSHPLAKRMGASADIILTSGSAFMTFFIRASGSSTNGWTFLIGLPMNTYTTGTFEGISSAGTRETAVFGSASWSTTRVASNGNVSTDSSTLFNGIPVVPGLMVVQRASDGASIFLISSGSFAAVLGARSGPAAGYVEVLGR